MRSKLARVVLWLFVIDLGIAFGAGIYEARVVIPRWAGTAPATWPNTGLLFWVYVTTAPLTLLTIASAILAWREHSPLRAWWLRAVALAALERVATFSFFVPTMIRLMSTESVSQAEVDATLSRWLLLNNGRHLLALGAWLAALSAFSLQHARRD
jgi:hypothetical protein